MVPEVPAQAVNLTVSSVDAGPVAPVELRPGDPLVLGAFLENTEAGAAGPFWLEFWGSRTGGLTLDLFLGDSIWFPGLAGGGTLSVAETQPLYSIPDGPYTVVFAVDRPGEVAETNERDNRAVVGWKRILVFRPPTDADLVVENFTFGPNPVNNGDALQLGGYVRNIGTEDTGGFWIEFWGSYDRVYPDLHFFLCDSIPVANLAPGAAVDLGQYERTLYDCPTGVFMAGVYADRFVSVNERDETNNYAFIDGIAFNQSLPTAEALVVGPDLVAAGADFAPWSPARLGAGSPLLISARIENRGAEASGPFWVEFWGADFGGLSPREFLVDSEYIVDLPAGGAIDLAFEKPLYSIPDGAYTVDILVDRPNGVAETNEGNNLLAVPGKRLLVSRPQTQANVVIENFAVAPNPLKAGMPIWTSGTVRNAGTEPSGPFWIEFWGSFDQDYPGLGFMLCDSIAAPSLAPGEAVDLSDHPRFLYPNVPVGPCAIVCFADRTDLVNELNEADNYSILRNYSVEFGPEEITIMLPGDVPLVMVRIPTGSFQMGSEGDTGWEDTDERPVHTVNIAYDFYMGKYELTQQQWLALMSSWPGTAPSTDFGLGDNYPAYWISWYECQDFIGALNTHVTNTGQGPATFRLPSESEWEYACRAGSTARFCFGDSTLGRSECNPGPPGDLGDYAWFCGNNGQWGAADYGSKEVGTKLPNTFGLYDTHGNLSEWCQDWHHSAYTGAPGDGSAWEAPTGISRVSRGGSWGSYAKHCRAAARHSGPPDGRGPYSGFRLARTASVQLGTVTIDVTPDAGSWTLTGPPGFSTLTGTGDRTSASAITDAPTGEYTLTCDDNIPGYNPPGPKTLRLRTAGTISLTGVYWVEPEEITVLLPGDVPLVMVRVPAGNFQMGSEGDTYWEDRDERPVHTVNIACDFYMGKYETTQQQWLALMGSWPGNAPSSWSGLGDNYPAYYVSWNDVQDFIKALNTHVTNTGQGPATFRLPSESEWEYSCRAGSTTRFCFGDSTLGPYDCNPGPPGDLGDYAWFCGNSRVLGDTDDGSKEVGSKLPNAFGLHDMHGNLWEWCQDWYHRDYTGAPADGSAWETPTGSSRVVRGGSCGSFGTRACRSACRNAILPVLRYEFLGFRLARTAGSVQTGAITIDVTPDAGSWTLTGPPGFSTLTGTGDRTSASAISDAPPGDYTLTCDDNVPGYGPPASETLTLVPGGTIAFTPTYIREPGPEAITIMLPGDVPLVMVRIPAGSFKMGTPGGAAGDPGWAEDREAPAHIVDIAYDFYMGKYELTQQQWLALMGSWPGTAPRATYGLGNNYPAYYISWNDCQNFIAALNTHVTNTGQGPVTFRLPSEAESEYACRAGSTARFCFGDSTLGPRECNPGPPGDLGDYAWFCGNNGQGGTARYGSKEVGTKLPDAFGLYDMHGNVYEWCQDWYHSDYTGAPTDGSAWETPTGTYRVVRGGGWLSVPAYCRSAYRVFSTPNYRYDHVGFRLARTATSAQMGSVTIDVTPDAGSWTLIGPPGFSTLAGTGDRTSTAAITNAPPGDYTLTCDDNVPGYDPPASETLTLDPGGTIAFTPMYTPEPEPQEITILLPGDVPLVMVRVPAGNFEMGSSGDTGWDFGNEAPVHTVNIGYDFYMGKHEVTQQQWLALMGSWPGPQPDAFYGLGDNYPAYWVSWNDAQSFITALNTHVMNTNQGPAAFRLPSEAEWEYACRAGSTTRFCFGDSTLGPTDCNPGPAGDLGDYAWFCGNNNRDGHPHGSKQVGTKLPNAFSLYDMHGNLFEWCQDWYHDSYTGAPVDGSAWQMPAGTCRMLRGGSWYSDLKSCRAAFRLYRAPVLRNGHVGFRVVRSARTP